MQKSPLVSGTRGDSRGATLVRLAPQRTWRGDGLSQNTKKTRGDARVEKASLTQQVRTLWSILCALVTVASPARLIRQLPVRFATPRPIPHPRSYRPLSTAAFGGGGSLNAAWVRTIPVQRLCTILL